VKPTLKPSTQERWFGLLRLHLQPAFPGALRAVTLAAAEGYIARRCAAGVAPSTVNRKVTMLKHMLARAVRWNYLGEYRLAQLKPLAEPEGRTRYLAPDEIAPLLAACDFQDARTALARGYLRPFVLVALNTGMRRNELLSLTRRSVDWANRFVTLEKTKNGAVRHVYLNATALETLRSLPARIDDERLFPFTPSQISMAFGRAATRAGINEFRLHDLRHTYASYHAMSGIQPRGLQALLGHRDARQTARYSHFADEYLRAAVERVNLGALLESGPDRSKNGTYMAPAVVGDRG
jgi:integrase